MPGSLPDGLQDRGCHAVSHALSDDAQPLALQGLAAQLISRGKPEGKVWHGYLGGGRILQVMPCSSRAHAGRWPCHADHARQQRGLGWQVAFSACLAGPTLQHC